VDPILHTVWNAGDVPVLSITISVFSVVRLLIGELFIGLTDLSSPLKDLAALSGRPDLKAFQVALTAVPPSFSSAAVARISLVCRRSRDGPPELLNHSSVRSVRPDTAVDFSVRLPPSERPQSENVDEDDDDEYVFLRASERCYTSRYCRPSNGSLDKT
jgi:hypothetical protein